MTRTAGRLNDGPIPSASFASNLPPPVWPPAAGGLPGPPLPQPGPRPTPQRPRHTVALRVAVAALAVVALAVAAGVIFLRSGDRTTPAGDGNPAASTVPADEAGSAEETSFVDAESAYRDGRCADAIRLFEQALARPEALAAIPRQLAEARVDECGDFLALADQAGGDPAAALSSHVAFLAEHPDSALAAQVTDALRATYQAGGRALLRPEACDQLLASTDAARVLGASDPNEPALGCAVAYAGAGRAAEAFTVLTRLLAEHPEVVLTDADAPALQAAMVHAAEVDDPEALADLQIAFLAALPTHPDASAVEAALVDNVAACDRLDEMRGVPTLAIRAGFLAGKTLACAQFAEYVGDTTAAVEGYQWFVDNAAGDPRMDLALAGLARGQIAQARATGADVYERPERSGGTGSSRTEITIYNDAPQALTVVVTGPETRFETIVASSTSTEYSLIGPMFCRTDVPVLTISLAPGVYEVMLRYEGITPSVGTWTLDPGAEYRFCNYIVSTFSTG